MIKKQFLLQILMILCVSYGTLAQKIRANDDVLLFKDANTQKPVLIVNDSLLFKDGKAIPFKHSNYPDKLSEYIPFEIGTKTYLVHQGCGPVVEFRNDSIVRIDNSFLQKNQFHSVPFTYKNEIYLFGGYGLFTYKNIITRYDFKSGEWNQVQTRGASIPEPSSRSYSLQKGDSVYIFSGNTSDTDHVPNYKLVQPTIWKLYLPTMTWSQVSNYNPSLLTLYASTIAYKDKLLILGGSITELNFSKKTARNYSFKNYEIIKKHYIIGDTIYGIFCTSENQYYFKKTTLADLKGPFIESIPFFVEPQSLPLNSRTLGFSVLVFLVVLVIAYKKKHLFQSVFNGITFDSKNTEFLYKRKIITHFEENEKKILYFLLNHIDQFVSLNQLNALFENPAQPETQSAIFKRREQAINGLLNKVSKLTSIPEEQLLLEQKNTEDKRLKDLLLLPKLLRKV